MIARDTASCDEQETTAEINMAINDSASLDINNSSHNIILGQRYHDL